MKFRNSHIRNIADVKPISDADNKCLAEIAEVLRRHKALSRFGVFLVHKHFDVRQNETLVERCDHTNRTLTVAPAKIADLQENGLVETNWIFVGAKPTPQVSCEIYCERDEKGRHKTYHKKER